MSVSLKELLLYLAPLWLKKWAIVFFFFFNVASSAIIFIGQQSKNCFSAFKTFDNEVKKLSHGKQLLLVCRVSSTLIGLKMALIVCLANLFQVFKDLNINRKLV